MAMRFIIVLLFIFTSFSANAVFDNCSCPVVTCEPCQVQIVLGREAKSCGVGQTIQCEKSVCENVDNYFQCVAGEPALFVPPQRQTFPVTEPQFSNVERVANPEKNEINFAKINASEDWEDEPLPQQSDVLYTTQRKIIPAFDSSQMDPEDYIQLRGVASSSKPQTLLKVTHVTGDVRTSQQIKLKKDQQISLGQYVTSKKPSQLTLSFGSIKKSTPFTIDLKMELISILAKKMIF